MAISPDHENARLQSLVPQFHCRTLILARRLKKYPPTALARQKKCLRGSAPARDGARIQTSHSSSVVRITGIALGWIGSTIAFGAVFNIFG